MGDNYRNFILYKINQKKAYTEMNIYNNSIWFDGEKVLDSLQEDDLEMIINEYPKYEQERMNMILNPEAINKIVDISNQMKAKKT